jgi:hypothetical protein
MVESKFHFLKKLFIYSHVYKLFGSFLPSAPLPHKFHFFCVVVGFELRVPHLLNRHSIPWAEGSEHSYSQLSAG